MFFVCLFFSLAMVFLLVFKHGRSKHKTLVTITIFMIMTGIICWGYNSITLSASYKTNMGNGAFYALANQPFAFLIGMVLLGLSIPCTLFCLLSKSKELEEIDKLLEDQEY